jgi:hypothetical protein
VSKLSPRTSHLTQRLDTLDRCKVRRKVKALCDTRVVKRFAATRGQRGRGETSLSARPCDRSFGAADSTPPRFLVGQLGQKPSGSARARQFVGDTCDVMCGVGSEDQPSRFEKPLVEGVPGSALVGGGGPRCGAPMAGKRRSQKGLCRAVDSGLADGTIQLLA